MARRDLPTSPRLASTRSSIETRVDGATAESEPGRALSAGTTRINDPRGSGFQGPASWPTLPSPHCCSCAPAL
eukprot:2865421-Alexandrium_andersonii.AAC.1